MTQINKRGVFNWESLIIKKDANPIIALDTMITIYKIGFDYLGKEILGPWPVPKGGDRIMKLHKHIGLGEIIYESNDKNYMIIFKPHYDSRIKYLERKGFALII